MSINVSTHGIDTADIPLARQCSDATVLLLWYGACLFPGVATPCDGRWCDDHGNPIKKKYVTQWAIVDPTAADTDVSPAEPSLPDPPQIGLPDSALADIAVNIATVLGVSPTECLRSVGQLMRDQLSLQLDLHRRTSLAAIDERGADRKTERLRAELASLKEKLLIEAREYMTAKRVALDAIARLAKARGALYTLAEGSTELSDGVKSQTYRIFGETRGPEWWPDWAGDWDLQDEGAAVNGVE